MSHNSDDGWDFTINFAFGVVGGILFIGVVILVVIVGNAWLRAGVP